MRWRQALWWKAEIYRPDEGINIHLCIWLSFSFGSHKNDWWSIYLYFLPMQKVTLGKVCFLSLQNISGDRSLHHSWLEMSCFHASIHQGVKWRTQQKPERMNTSLVYFSTQYFFFFHFYITWETHEEERKKNPDALKKDPWLFKRETKHGLEKYRNKKFWDRDSTGEGRGTLNAG